MFSRLINKVLLRFGTKNPFYLSLGPEQKIYYMLEKELGYASCVDEFDEYMGQNGSNIHYYSRDYSHCTLRIKVLLKDTRPDVIFNIWAETGIMTFAQEPNFQLGSDLTIDLSSIEKLISSKLINE